MEDNGPDESQSKLGISVHDIFASDVDQFDFFVTEEPKCSFHILNGMETHPASLSRLKKRWTMKFYDVMAPICMKYILESSE